MTLASNCACGFTPVGAFFADELIAPPLRDQLSALSSTSPPASMLQKRIKLEGLLGHAHKLLGSPPARKRGAGSPDRPTAALLSERGYRERKANQRYSHPNQHGGHDPV